MNNHLISEQDCSIERNLQGHPNQAVLMTCDGDELLIVPDDWRDEQIWTALRFANWAYAKGKFIGAYEKVQDFKKVMEIG